MLKLDRQLAGLHQAIAELAAMPAGSAPAASNIINPLNLRKTDL